MIYSSKDFEDVVAFSVSEPGAMGLNDIGFFMKDGTHFRLYYKSNETPWSSIREWFPTLKECCFNGPMETESTSMFTVVIGASDDDKETHVASGRRHWYLDFGNHLVIKEPYYREIRSLLGEKENVDLTFCWEEMLAETDFVERANIIQNEIAQLEANETNENEKGGM